MSYFFLWESISSSLGGRRVLAGPSTCGSGLTSTSLVSDKSGGSELFAFSDAACGVSLGGRNERLNVSYIIVHHLSLPSSSDLHNDVAFCHWLRGRVFPVSVLRRPTRHPLWMVRITVFSGKDCIFFNKFPSLFSRLHILHLLVFPTEMSLWSWRSLNEVLQYSSQGIFNPDIDRQGVVL